MLLLVMTLVGMEHGTRIQFAHVVEPLLELFEFDRSLVLVAAVPVRVEVLRVLFDALNISP